MIPVPVLIELFIITIGFFLLTKSADEAITRLVALSRHFNVSEFFISFILVGSLAVLPELSIGISSALNGSPSFGLGIVFGSNIADLTLVVGLVIISTHSMALHSPVIKKSKWFLIAVALPVLFLLDSELSSLEGLLLISAYALYVFWLHKGKPVGKNIDVKARLDKRTLATNLLVLMAALALLFFMGHVISNAALEIGLMLSLPVFFIGAILAVGTCLPELTLAIRASNHNHGELGFGNILGNVMADSMGTLGIIALIAPIRPAYPALAITSGFFMILSMLALILLLRFKKKLDKMDGVFLIILYMFFFIAQVIAEKMIVSG